MLVQLVVKMSEKNDSGTRSPRATARSPRTKGPKSLVVLGGEA